MSAFLSKEELAFLPANRVSHPEHYADAQSQRSKPGLVARLRGWLVRNAAMAELRTLSDRELADIGLNRAELGHVFDTSFANRSR